MSELAYDSLQILHIAQKDYEKSVSYLIHL